MESLDFTLWRLEEHRCFTAKNSDLHGSKIKSVALKIRCTESTFPEQRLMRRNIPPPLPQASVVLVDPLDHQILDRELDQLANWPITADQRRRLIDYVLVKAREMVERMPPHHNSAQLQFVVEVCHMRMNPEMNTEERLLMEEPGPNRMVPAEESSIESLVKRRFTDHEYSGDCSVCLEEMLLGTQVTSMPCAHVFHGDCIQKWLRTSRYCPVCRFQMPTGQRN